VQVVLFVASYLFYTLLRTASSSNCLTCKLDETRLNCGCITNRNPKLAIDRSCMQVRRVW